MKKITNYLTLIILLVSITQSSITRPPKPPKPPATKSIPPKITTTPKASIINNDNDDSFADESDDTITSTIPTRPVTPKPTTKKPPLKSNTPSTNKKPIKPANAKPQQSTLTQLLNVISDHQFETILVMSGLFLATMYAKNNGYIQQASEAISEGAKNITNTGIKKVKKLLGNTVITVDDNNNKNHDEQETNKKNLDYIQTIFNNIPVKILSAEVKKIGSDSAFFDQAFKDKIPEITKITLHPHANPPRIQLEMKIPGVKPTHIMHITVKKSKDSNINLFTKKDNDQYGIDNNNLNQLEFKFFEQGKEYKATTTSDFKNFTEAFTISKFDNFDKIIKQDFKKNSTIQAWHGKTKEAIAQYQELKKAQIDAKKKQLADEQQKKKDIEDNKDVLLQKQEIAEKKVKLQKDLEELNKKDNSLDIPAKNKLKEQLKTLINEIGEQDSILKNNEGTWGSKPSGWWNEKKHQNYTQAEKKYYDLNAKIDTLLRNIHDTKNSNISYVVRRGKEEHKEENLTYHSLNIIEKTDTGKKSDNGDRIYNERTHSSYKPEINKVARGATYKEMK